MDEGLPARAAALDLLAGALSRRGGFEAALAAGSLSKLEPRDRAFAHALALATLRALGPIDAALDERLSRPPPDRVRNLLRIALAQAWRLGTPAYAAVNASVALAGAERGMRPFKGLVNAVLRRLAGEPPKMEAWAPDWLFQRWRTTYGEEAARAVGALIPAEPATDLSLRDPAEAALWAERLEAEVLQTGSLRVARRGEVSGWPGFETGAWWVQDAAAAIPARLLAPRPGQTALDLCAAPGGKSLQLAAMGATVTALDQSAPRLKRLAQNLARTGLAAEVVVADAAGWGDPRRFDAVLLDAPCSATGTFRRHPDVLWVSRPGEIAKLAAMQARLLDAAADRVHPGGRLVYCVCSLEREEGEDQATRLLERRPDFAAEPMTPGEGGGPEASLTAEGWLRILPHHLPGGLDGFFIARFRKAP